MLPDEFQRIFDRLGTADIKVDTPLLFERHLYPLRERRISIVVVSAAPEKAETKHQKAQPREKDKVKSEAKPKADEHSAHH